MSLSKCDFFFDFLSPYSYIGWVRFHRLKLHEKLQVCYKPVVLSRLIHAYETKGPAEIDSKRDYLFKHCLRYTKKESIDFLYPKKLPFNSQDLLRLCTWSKSESVQRELINFIFNLVWAKKNDVEDCDIVYLSLIHI